MYLSYFGFDEKPFSITPNPAYLYRSSKHRMALTYLQYSLSENIGFVLLTGEIGIGKTTLVRYILSELNDNHEVGVLFNTNFKADDLIKYILNEYELGSISDDKAANLDRLYSFLIKCHAKGSQPLLIIDEAQNLSMETLEEVRMLSNLQTDKESLLQIMLIGQPELRMRIRNPRLAQLAQRIAVSYHLGPLSIDETREYIRYRLKSAGSDRKDIFTIEAMDMVHEKSKGIPRSINILCDAALVYAYADELPTVDLEVMKQTISDREEEGVVKDGAVWEEPSGNGDNPGTKILPDMDRIFRLENKVADLSAQLNWQLKELNSRFEENKDELISKLTDLLNQERRKSDRYLLECSKSKLKIKELSKKIFDTDDSSDETSTASNNKELKKSSSWFLKKLFS